MTCAAQILQAGISEMQDRAATYDNPTGERSIPATVEAFNAITGHALTAEQGWLFMALLKATRSQQGRYRADSYIDGAAYFGLMGEAAALSRSSTKVEVHPEPMTDERCRSSVSVSDNGNVLPSTDHLVDPSGKPRWQDAPLWANYLTQDANGVWTFWQKHPRRGSRGWGRDGMKAEVNSGEVLADWKDSLEQAPGLTGVAE